MGRREALRFAICAALLASARASAQPQGKVWRVGFLTPLRRSQAMPARYSAFLKGLRDLGYVEGRNLVIEWRYADDDIARLPALATDLVRANVDVLVAGGTPAARAAQRATSTVAIFMLGVGDPVGSGLAKSLARPGGNSTGISLTSPDLAGKWMELARSLVPSLSRVALLVNPTNPTRQATLDGVRGAGQSARVAVLPIEVRKAAELDDAFARVAQARAEAIMIQNEALFDEASRQIAHLAIRARIPTVTGRREFVEAGCLASYGSNLVQVYRHAASYVDRILKGAKPGEMPIEQPTSYEMAVNLATAKAIGLAVPREIVLRADRVVE